MAIYLLRLKRHAATVLFVNGSVKGTWPGVATCCAISEVALSYLYATIAWRPVM